MLKNQKAVQRIITLFSITLIGFMIIISLITFTYSKSYIESSTRDKAIQILFQTCSQAESTLYTISQSTKLLMSKTNLMQVLEYEGYYSSRNYAEKEQIVTALNDFIFINRNIQAAYIFDYLGNVYSTSDYKGSFTLEDFSKAAQSSPGNLVWMDRTSSNELVICKELYNISLKPVGVLVIHLNDAAFSNIFKWQAEELHSKVSILDKDSDFVIYTSDTDTATTSRQLLDQSNETGSPLQTKLTINQKQYYYYRYESENNGFTYIYYIPVNYFTRGLSNTCLIIFCITLLFLILLLLLYYYVKTTIQEPLGKIINCVNHFALKGDILHIDFDYDDEFRELYLHFTDMGKRIQRLIINTYELEILNRNQEIKILQAQINPHFVYNTLELTNSIAANHGIGQICRLTKSLSNILRYTINDHQEEVPLSKELYHINEYIQIQNERFLGELSYTKEIDESILDFPIMKLTLQPVIENCFHHGFLGKWNDCQINLKAGPHKKGFYISISDNGNGIPPELLDSILSDEALNTSGNGIALRNIHKRLRLKYGENSGLYIRSTPGNGTCITIFAERSLSCLN